MVDHKSTSYGHEGKYRGCMTSKWRLIFYRELFHIYTGVVPEYGTERKLSGLAGLNSVSESVQYA